MLILSRLKPTVLALHIAVLQRCLTDTKPAMRAAAATAFGRLENETLGRHAAALEETLADRNVRVREAAASALCELELHAAKMLRSPDAAVQMIAVKALATIKTKEVLAAQAPLLADLCKSDCKSDDSLEARIRRFYRKHELSKSTGANAGYC